MHSSASNGSAFRLHCILGLLLSVVAAPALAGGKIIWNGDFETGNYNQWPLYSNTSDVTFPEIPAYGRPLQYSSGQIQTGDGSLSALVTTTGGGIYETGPVRQGKYAVRLTIKNSADGSEPADCDAGGTNCTHRRTEIDMHPYTCADVYNCAPEFQERWWSFSVYLPADYEVACNDINSFNCKPIVFQIKGRNGNCCSPAFAVQAMNSTWFLVMRTGTKALSSSSKNSDFNFSEYWATGTYAQQGGASNGGASSMLVNDYPSQSASKAALADMNLGGWTDFVLDVKPDPRSNAEGGTGFLKLWMRAGSGSWVQVLDVQPAVLNGMSRGIFYNDPGNGKTNALPAGWSYGTSAGNGGFNPLSGIYVGKAGVWNASHDMTIYEDNFKIGDQNTTFDQMSPDGSTPTSGPQSPTKRPSAPILAVQPN